MMVLSITLDRNSPLPRVLASSSIRDPGWQIGDRGAQRGVTEAALALMYKEWLVQVLSVIFSGRVRMQPAAGQNTFYIDWQCKQARRTLYASNGTKKRPKAKWLDSKMGIAY